MWTDKDTCLDGLSPCSISANQICPHSMGSCLKGTVTLGCPHLQVQTRGLAPTEQAPGARTP